MEVSGAIGKLDDISNEIISILAANRTGAAAKKRRILERKLNTMKTDMEKLNQNLLNTKTEVDLQEQNNFQLQAKLNLKDEEIETLEVAKISLQNATDKAKKEESQAKTDKMDVIFMYEERIKELKLKIPEDVECENKSSQTEAVTIEAASDDENSSIASDESVESVPRTKSAQPRLEVSTFEIIHIDSQDRPKTADNSMLHVPKAAELLAPSPSVFSEASTTSRGCQTDECKSPASNESTIAQPPSIKPPPPPQPKPEIKVKLKDTI